MAAFWKIICLLAVFCITAEANNDTSTNTTGNLPPVPPQNQFGFVFSFFNQTTPSPNRPMTNSPSNGGQAAVGPSIGVGSVSYTGIDGDSSEEESDIDTDTDVDVNEADGVPSYVYGSYRNRVSGNTRPMLRGNRRQRVMSGVQAGDRDGDVVGDFVGDHDQLIGRSTGTSGRGVGIALGVLGLLALIIAAAFFIIRKQRNSRATFVRI
eukprot:XP_011669170.1 PREDICTED: uncharacterized protein LOC105440562 [Strongylocentrotus purpuratus]